MKLKKISITLLIMLLIVSCATNPFTGKKTLALVPDSQIFPSSFVQYKHFLSENKVVKGTRHADMVKRVGERIAVAAERWMDANNLQGYLKNYKWEYNLVNNQAVNAWCMPGGKIVFYTGLLPIAENETAVAAVMGHEVAHALANHGQQRMSAGMLRQFGAIAGNIAIKDTESRALFNQVYGVGSQVGVMLPFDRKHETEADKIGLYLMAIAGYNPMEASELWKRMKAHGGQSPPEILSTHPSNDSRIAQLKKLAPQVMKEAEKFGVKTYRPLGKF